MSLLARDGSLKKRGSKEARRIRFSSFWRGMSSSTELPDMAIRHDVFAEDRAALRSDWQRVGDDMRFAFLLFDETHRHELEKAQQKSLFNDDDYKAK